MPRWKVKSNDFIFPIDNATLAAADIAKVSATEFNCISNNRSVNVQVLSEDIAANKIQVCIDGEVFEVEIKDSLYQMLDEMGFSKTVVKQVKEVKAPMPGVVLDIAVLEGDAVKEGDKLLTLGAMKMENSITISSDAVIKCIAVKPGQAVDKGQVLVELA